MIVQPDFLEHFKTKALVKLTKDEAAPLAVLRLWGHCQTSRRWQFPNMTPEQLAALCAWGERKPKCHTALVKAGFLRVLPGGGFAAHQWDEINARLVHNWKQGTKGGRPKNKESGGGKGGSKNNPLETQGFSSNNPAKTDQTRSDQIRSCPKSNSGGTGVGVEGGTTAAVFVVPKFEPIAPGTFRRELAAELEAAEESLRALRRRDDAWLQEARECKDARDGVNWTKGELAKGGLTEERRAKLERDLAAFEGRLLKPIKVGLTTQAQAVADAWTKRIEDLKRALAGVRQ